MPELGDTTSAKALGLKGTYRLTWMACEVCGKQRWVQTRDGRPRYGSARCKSCARTSDWAMRDENGFGRMVAAARGCGNNNWKGGRQLSKDGYVYVLIYPDSPFYGMVRLVREGKSKRILEHRLAMAQHLNRPLLKSEHVHHRNGDKTDNRIENLELISPKNHVLYKSMCADCELRKEIRLLRWQIGELTKQLQGELR